MSKISLTARRTLHIQPYHRKVLCFQRNIQYGDFHSYRKLKIASSNFLMAGHSSRAV
jgi:hypothetical protein